MPTTGPLARRRGERRDESICRRRKGVSLIDAEREEEVNSVTHRACASEETLLWSHPYDAGTEVILRGCLPHGGTGEKTKEGAGAIQAGRKDLPSESHRNYGYVDSITTRGVLNRIIESTRCHDRTQSERIERNDRFIVLFREGSRHTRTVQPTPKRLSQLEAACQGG